MAKLITEAEMQKRISGIQAAMQRQITDGEKLLKASDKQRIQALNALDCVRMKYDSALAVGRQAIDKLGEALDLCRKSRKAAEAYKARCGQYEQLLQKLRALKTLNRAAFMDAVTNFKLEV